MISDSNNDLSICGIHFIGSEYLPEDLPLSLEDIRSWAHKQKILKFERQIIGSSRVERLSKIFSPKDHLEILVELWIDEQGKLCYQEYPFFSIKSLIEQAKEIEINFWRMVPTAWNYDGTVRTYGEIQFHYYYPEIEDEDFFSISCGKLVAQRFNDFYNNLPDGYEKQTLSEGILEVDAWCEVKARFFRSGRLNDVELKFIENPQGSGL